MAQYIPVWYYQNMAKNNKGTGKRGKNSGLTPKEREFCRNFVELRNGAEAVRRSYDISNPKSGTPRVMANELLRKEHIRNEIELLMFKAGLDMLDVIQVHKRNMMQEDDLSVSQRAVKDYYQVTGKLQNDSKPEMKVAFIIEEK